MYDPRLDSEQGFAGLRRVIQHYQQIYLPCEKKDRRHYRSLTLYRAIDSAGHLLRHDGQCHDHARNCSDTVLDRFTDQLTQRISELAGHDTFPAIHKAVGKAAGHSLAAHLKYDAALMLAWNRGTEPAEVWLHSGAARGYLKLGASEGHGKTTVTLDELPSAFRELPAWQVEDILCIYKRLFARMCNGYEVPARVLAPIAAKRQQMGCGHTGCTTAC